MIHLRLMNHSPYLKLTVRLLCQLDFPRPPGLVKPGHERAIHAQDHKPAFTLGGFQPVVLVPLGRPGSEIDVVGTVIVGSDALGLTADGREGLAGLQHRARLAVVNRHCPEVVNRHIGRNVQLVGLAAVKGLLFRIDKGDTVV